MRKRVDDSNSWLDRKREDEEIQKKREEREKEREGDREKERA